MKKRAHTELDLMTLTKNQNQIPHQKVFTCLDFLSNNKHGLFSFNALLQEVVLILPLLG